ncbi:hypothetical protein M8C21_029264, partial [Ambrosia artemisiifolia]
EQDRRDAKDEAERRKQQEKARAKGPGGGRNARKPVRKAAPKKPSAASAVVIEPMETSANSSMETGTVNNAPAAKPRGKAAGQKKAPAKSKGKATLVDEDDDEIPSLAERMAKQNLHSPQVDDEIVELEDRLAKHNIESSPDQEGKPCLYLIN